MGGSMKDQSNEFLSNKIYSLADQQQIRKEALIFSQKIALSTPQPPRKKALHAAAAEQKQIKKEALIFSEKIALSTSDKENLHPYLLNEEQVKNPLRFSKKPASKTDQKKTSTKPKKPGPKNR